jgi:hypothetical protein
MCAEHETCYITWKWIQGSSNLHTKTKKKNPCFLYVIYIKSTLHCVTSSFTHKSILPFSLSGYEPKTSAYKSIINCFLRTTGATALWLRHTPLLLGPALCGRCSVRRTHFLAWTHSSLKLVHTSDVITSEPLTVSGRISVLHPYHSAFKAQWQLYVPPALTISDFSFYIYLFRTILAVNSDYFLKQPLTGWSL